MNGAELQRRFATGERSFFGADLQGADLAQADLHGIDLHGADLSDASLTDAVLVGANLDGAILIGADLHGAHLQHAALRRAYLADANLHRADLTDADLHRADLTDANLTEAVLHGADLHKANLHGALLAGADLRGADLHGAVLIGTDLHGTTQEAGLGENCPWQSLCCLEEVHPAIETVTLTMAGHGYRERDIFGMRLALEEAIVNGLKHGHMYDPSKRVVIRYRVGSEHVLVEVKDQGPGFEPSQIPDSTAPENLERPSGRGLLLMRSYMTWIRYNKQGNSVTLCLKKYQQPSKQG
jgi:serine/threonine-protein kinase RsbW